jgi:hypothetical protein
MVATRAVDQSFGCRIMQASTLQLSGAEGPIYFMRFCMDDISGINQHVFAGSSVPLSFASDPISGPCSL